MRKIPASVWKQWAVNRPIRVRGNMKTAFEKLVEQVWKYTVI
jgi:hypothetical protein